MQPLTKTLFSTIHRILLTYFFTMAEQQQISLVVPYEEKISRLFIFRGLWAIVMVWPLLVWSLWIALIEMVEFWYMLILGRRHKALWEKKVRFFRHVTMWNAYFKFAVDKRPKFIED